ncbi:MAG: DUF4231 domain-containing protein [Anaerolineaceae bacterium]|nr:DUF4231 domain-containing protein [Anaerolineaceae bacterium]
MSEKPPQQKPSESAKPVKQDFASMGRRSRRSRWPAWAQFLPLFNFPDSPNYNFSLILRDWIPEILQKHGLNNPQIQNSILEDLDFLDYELQRLFRERDFAAKRSQNDNRMAQVLFMFLAMIATLIGSLQALALTGNPEWMPYFAFAETLVALLTTYIATTRGRKDHGQSWYSNRARAEFLRREFFRYLMRIDPYSALSPVERRSLLSLRAAEINRGTFPTVEEETK